MHGCLYVINMRMLVDKLTAARCQLERSKSASRGGLSGGIPTPGAPGGNAMPTAAMGPTARKACATQGQYCPDEGSTLPAGATGMVAPGVGGMGDEGETSLFVVVARGTVRVALLEELIAALELLASVGSLLLDRVGDATPHIDKGVHTRRDVPPSSLGGPTGDSMAETQGSAGQGAGVRQACYEKCIPTVSNAPSYAEGDATHSQGTREGMRGDAGGGVDTEGGWEDVVSRKGRPKRGNWPGSSAAGPGSGEHQGPRRQGPVNHQGPGRGVVVDNGELVHIDLQACCPRGSLFGGLSALPLVNGWLLDYPVIYCVPGTCEVPSNAPGAPGPGGQRSRDQGQSNSTGLKMTTLEQHQVRLQSCPLLRRLAVGKKVVPVPSVVTDDGHCEGYLLCSFTVPQDITGHAGSDVTAAEQVHAFMRRIGARQELVKDIWGPPLLSTTTKSMQSVVL
eukprot:jgi/Mesvir1/25189/Mv12888-RA.1